MTGMLLSCGFAVAAAAMLAAPGVRAMETTPLDTFVHAEDPEFTYLVADTDVDLLHTRYTLYLTSGSWRSAGEVDRTLWNHWVTIYVPHLLSKGTALLVISGGSNDSLPDFGELDNALGPLAFASESVIVDLGQVPNQPLTFTGESEARSEDALLAYSWQQFLADPADTSWPAHLPMTRAAVRAMDAVQQHLAEVRPSRPITDFIVAGASKRGWTTWLTAAAENGPLGRGRVSSIIPIVIDVLNTEASFDHHFKVYGFWAPAVGDYVEAGCMDHLGSPESEALFDIVDPHSYLDRLTMPKFIFNATGDQFFLPDSSKFYYGDLPGMKRLRYFPNRDHGLGDPLDLIGEILPLYLTLTDDGAAALDQATWTTLADGAIELQTDDAGVSVELWQATNPAARDFRLGEIGASFTSIPLLDQGGGRFTGNVAPPADGWTAYLVEATFSDGTAATSGVHLATRPQPLNLRIRRTGEGIELSFDSKRGEWYRLHAGSSPEDLSPVESIVPSADITTWIDPHPADPRKFYQLESIEP